MTELFFAILTVLAVWAFLGVLIVGLLLILKSLQSIRAWFERVTVGVRAVEHQSAPLTAHLDALRGSLDEAVAALSRAAEKVGEAERKLGARAPGLREQS